MDSKLKVGDRVMVVHPDEQEWHERLLTHQVTKTQWMMLTPDEDHYAVDLGSDIDDWEPMGPRGGPGAKVRRSSWLIYRFRNLYTAEQLAKVFREGEKLA